MSEVSHEIDFRKWYDANNRMIPESSPVALAAAFKAGWNALAERIIKEHKNSSYHPYPSPQLCTECEILFRSREGEGRK
jgi:hypothetical protein